MQIEFKSVYKESATISIGNIWAGSTCDKPIKVIEMKPEDTKSFDGITKKVHWMMLIPADPETGFTLCIEQAGRKFLGVEYYHLGYSN